MEEAPEAVPVFLSLDGKVSTTPLTPAQIDRANVEVCLFKCHNRACKNWATPLEVGNVGLMAAGITWPCDRCKQRNVVVRGVLTRGRRFSTILYQSAPMPSVRGNTMAVRAIHLAEFRPGSRTTRTDKTYKPLPAPVTPVPRSFRPVQVSRAAHTPRRVFDPVRSLRQSYWMRPEMGLSPAEGVLLDAVFPQVSRITDAMCPSVFAADEGGTDFSVKVPSMRDPGVLVDVPDPVWPIMYNASTNVISIMDCNLPAGHDFKVVLMFKGSTLQAWYPGTGVVMCMSLVQAIQAVPAMWPAALWLKEQGSTLFADFTPGGGMGGGARTGGSRYAFTIVEPGTAEVTMDGGARRRQRRRRVCFT